MAKRKRLRKDEFRTTVRLSDDIKQALTKLMNATGWSYGQTLSFISTAGIDLLYSGGKGGDAMRDVLTAAIDAKAVIDLAEKTIRTEREKLNDARKAMTKQIVPPADLPDKPAPGHGGRVIVSGKRRGRPPKHRTEPLPELNPETASGTIQEGPESQ